MDAKKFDDLIARLTRAANRRDAVKGAVGGALAAVGVTAVAAKSKAKGKGKGKKSNCKEQVAICEKTGQYGGKPTFRRTRVSKCKVKKHLAQGDCRPGIDYGCTC
jgi:hypothetical protein